MSGSGIRQRSLLTRAGLIGIDAGDSEVATPPAGPHPPALHAPCKTHGLEVMRMIDHFCRKSEFLPILSIDFSTRIQIYIFTYSF